MSLIFLMQILYLLVPAAFANMAPVFVKNKFNFLDYPVDFRLIFFGRRLFGDNKTFRGFIFGIFSSILIVFIQSFLYRYEIFAKISLISYNEINILVFGFLIGFSVLLGDLISSFIKRRFNFKPGESFYILDQVNGGLGFVFVIIPIYFKSWSLALWIVLIWLLGHLVIKYLGYLFRFEKKKI